VHETGATIILLTHAVKNSDMDKALDELRGCDFLNKLASCIRIFEPSHA
jgi:hypothetical protein